MEECAAGRADGVVIGTCRRGARTRALVQNPIVPQSTKSPRARSARHQSECWVKWVRADS